MALRQRSREELLRLVSKEKLDLKRVEEIWDEIDWMVAEAEQAKIWRDSKTKTKVKTFTKATDWLVDAWKELPHQRRNQRHLVEAVLILVEESEQSRALLEPGDRQRLDSYRKELAIGRALNLLSEMSDPMINSPTRLAQVAAILYGKGTFRTIARACRKFLEERQAVIQWAANNREVLEAARENGIPIIEPHYVSGSRKARLRFGTIPFFKEGEEPTWPVEELIDPPEQLLQHKHRP